MKGETVKQIDILILSHNRSWSLMQTISSIRQNTRWPYRIIIHDNGSTDEHLSHISKLGQAPDIKLIRHPHFLTCAQGRVEGMNHVESEYCVFLDDDIRVTYLWLTRLMQPMMLHANAAAVASNIKNDDEPWQGGIRRIAANGRLDIAQYQNEGRGDICIGGATLYRTSALEQREDRSAEYHSGFEDWDQSLQFTREMGMEVWGSRAEVYHKHQKDGEAYRRDERNRYTEIMDCAISMWERWGIKQGFFFPLKECLAHEIPLRPDQWDAIKEARL